VVEIHEGVGWPQLLAQLFARDHLAGALEQQGQHLKGLLLQAQLRTILAQLARGEVQLEDSKPHKSAGVALESGHETITAIDDD
jgi:hypothetical protein